MKRFLALLLTLMMVLSISPAAIWAEEQNTNEQSYAVENLKESTEPIFTSAPLTSAAWGSSHTYTAYRTFGWNGVCYFTDMSQNTLDYNPEILYLSNGMVVATVPGATSQTLYLTVPTNNTLTVTNWKSDDNLLVQQDGTWIDFEGKSQNIYKLTVNRPADYPIIDYTVTRTVNGVPGADVTSLIFDFTPILTDDGDSLRGNWDVGIFTELNGTQLSCDDTTVSQWHDTIFVAGGAVDEITVYLTLATDTYFTLTSQSGGYTIYQEDMEMVGKWWTGNRWKFVYKLTVQNPHNANYTVSYDAVNEWSDGNVARFNLTFDFAPTLTGNVANVGIGNVMLADALSNSGVLSYNDTFVGTPMNGGVQGVIAACAGKSQHTLYLVTAADQTLSISGAIPPVSFKRVGTFLYNGSVLGKVYELTVNNSVTDIVSYTINRDWGIYNNNGTELDFSDDYSDPAHAEFPVMFDFFITPTWDKYPLTLNNIRVYSSCDAEGNLGYLDNYDGMTYGPNSIVSVPAAANHSESIYLVSRNALTLTENTFNATLEVYEGAVVTSGYTAYRLTVPAQSPGNYALTVSDGATSTVFNFSFVAGKAISGTVTSYLSGTDKVTITLLQNGVAVYTTTVNGNSAAYSIEDVVAGTYTLIISKDNHATCEYDLVVGNTDITQDVKLHLIGDIDGDGNLNEADKSLIFNIIDGTAGELTEYELLVGDINGDGKISAIDKKLMYNHIHGNSIWA